MSRGLTGEPLIDEKGRSVLLPLPGADKLPATLTLGGETFARKAELHATIVGGRERHPVAALREAARGAQLSVRPRGEYRLVRKEARRSLIELADINGLDEFYARLEAALGAGRGSIPRPPGHVTLYTAGDPAGRGIALYTEDELAALSSPLEPAPALASWR
ncbi:MAG: hypothetical protein SF051_01535 [Elusimicrobiota bacterium]|nr:hypothetical protein [Elusimicrobiota bacterium]